MSDPLRDELINTYVDQHLAAAAVRRVNEKVQGKLDGLFLTAWGKLTREEQDEALKRFRKLQQEQQQ